MISVRLCGTRSWQPVCRGELQSSSPDCGKWMIEIIIMRYKKADRAIESLQRGWYLNYGFPTVGLIADNGGDMRYYKIKKIL